MGKHNNRSVVPPQNSTLQTNPLYINKNAALMDGWKGDGDNANVFISIRFVKHEFECFSSWGVDEMKLFWDFLRKIHQYTWNMLRQQAGKGENKAGMGYTVIPVEDYPKNIAEDIDPSSNFFELRVSQKARVHCFRDKNICYIYLLDKDHKVFPQ